MSNPERLRISGGAVYDPANGMDGAVRDVCIDADRIVAELPRDAPRLDATGMIVMPGGVDIHSHVAGSSVNQARRLLPEERAVDPVPAPRLEDGTLARTGTGGTVPSTFATGYRYAGLGYTTAMEAAVAPLGARHAHAELDDTPSSTPDSLSCSGTTIICSARSQPARRREHATTRPGCSASP